MSKFNEKTFHLFQEICRRQRMHRQRLELDMELISILHDNGYSNRKIAKALGCSEGTIRNRLKELEDIHKY